MQPCALRSAGANLTQPPCKPRSLSRRARIQSHPPTAPCYTANGTAFPRCAGERGRKKERRKERKGKEREEKKRNPARYRLYLALHTQRSPRRPKRRSTPKPSLSSTPNPSTSRGEEGGKRKVDGKRTEQRARGWNPFVHKTDLSFLSNSHPLLAGTSLVWVGYLAALQSISYNHAACAQVLPL